MAACQSGNTTETASPTEAATQAATQTSEKAKETTSSNEAKASDNKQNQNIVTTTANVTSNGMIDASSLFTDRDLQQDADLTDATQYTLSDNTISRSPKRAFM